jgi:DNA-binding SARP family transcriptional activator
MIGKRLASPARVYLTGRLCVEVEDRLLEGARFPGHQGRLAFAILTAERSRPLTRDALAEAIWDDALPPAWEGALAAVISKVRSALSRFPLPGADIRQSAGTYQLVLPTDTWVDIEAAESSLEIAQRALAKHDAESAYGWALASYMIARRPLLSGEDGNWITRKRNELRTMLTRSLDYLVSIYITTQNPGLAIKFAEEALVLEPFRESMYQLLMRAHLADGNRAEAIGVYQRCRHALGEELGIAPSADTDRLYTEILGA